MNRKQRRARGQEQRKAGRAAPAAPDPALLHDAGIEAKGVEGWGGLDDLGHD